MSKAPNGSSGRTPSILLEELAVAVMSTEATDEAAVVQLVALLDELAGMNDPAAADAADAASAIRAAMADVRALAGALDLTSEAVARMQERAAKAAVPGATPASTAPRPAAPPPSAPTDPTAFVLPDWGDEKTLRDFLAAQKSTLEELEAAILAMEAGEKDRRAVFKRRLHTMKGEAGVLGLDDLEQVCHATEDYLEANAEGGDFTDRLLRVTDWMARAGEAYGRMRKPEPGAADVIRSLLGGTVPAPAAAEPPVAVVALPPPSAPAVQDVAVELADDLSPGVLKPAGQSATSAASAPPAAGAPDAVTTTAAPAGPPPPDAELADEAALADEALSADPAAPGHDATLEKVDRDAETVSLFGEFLSESAEGLNRVDQILMNVERDGVDGDTVNSLFRVFHTVKGTAGFLELSEVVALAHDTETMLNKCRENQLKLKGVVIDLVFDATAALREMLAGIREAVEAGTGFGRRAGLQPLLRRIKDATEGRFVPEKELPHVLPGEKLGEVVTHPPINIPPEAVERALQEQARTGRRLGEELVASGAAEPAQVAAALRAQARVSQAEVEGPVKLKDTIKVDLERVDSLVEMIGELVVVESMVVNAPEISKASSVRVRNCLAQLAKVTRDLQDVGMRMRMVPVAGVFQKMARLVRDLSRKSGKQVRLVTSGEGTEMDRSMVEQIADPLVHMIRNAVDHGLEPADVRTQAGKAPVGQIRLSAYHEGGSVIIEIADDGRGLNKDAIVRKAVEKGLIASGDGLPDHDIYGLIFAPGFSTAQKVTEISGRGVGMDVVKRNIDALRGRVVISSTPGAGTKFKLVLPLTLAIIDGMLVACGEERYIIPTLSIIESIQPDQKMLVSLAQSNEMINLRGEILPLLRLDRLFHLDGAKVDPTEALVVVVEGVGRRIGLLVDEVVTQQQVVIKNLGEGVGETRFVSGAAILSDGRVGLILNVEEIANLVHKSHDFFHDHGRPPPGAESAAMKEVQA